MQPTQSRRQRLTLEEVGNVTVVNFVDKKILDEQNIQILGEELFDLVDNKKKEKILLNFGNVEYFSSAMIGKLLTLKKKCDAAHAELVICKIYSGAMEIFRMNGLDRHFAICSTEQEALEASMVPRAPQT